MVFPGGHVHPFSTSDSFRDALPSGHTLLRCRPWNARSMAGAPGDDMTDLQVFQAAGRCGAAGGAAGGGFPDSGCSLPRRSL